MEHCVHWPSWCRRLATVWLLGAAWIPAWTADQEVARGIFQVGTLAPPGLRECSGVAPARLNPKVFWMHSDGRRPTLYAVQRGGQEVQTCLVDAPELMDWEDLASDHAGHLFVADIGNNEAQRTSLAVYQIAEPDPSKPAASLPVLQSWRLNFPKAPFDCESLFIWRGHGYVVAKVFEDQPAAIYRFPLASASQPVTLELVTPIKLTSPVTAADISPDGKQLAMTAKNGVYLFTINGDVAKAKDQTPAHARFKDKHIEGICFVPDGLLVTAETRAIYLFTGKAFNKPKDKAKK